MPFTDPKQREIVQEIGIFTKEAVCYRELFSQFEQSPEKVLKWRPDCWLARDDLMVMEDLVDAGFRAMPFQRPFGREHLTLIFERMAQMHACSLDLEYNQMKGKKLGERFGEMLYETTFMRKNPWFEAGLMVCLLPMRFPSNNLFYSFVGYSQGSLRWFKVLTKFGVQINHPIPADGQNGSRLRIIRAI